MKKSFSKRITAVFLAVVMLVSSVPFVSLAADDAIGQADRTLIIEGNDTLALAQYMQVADNEGYDAGNRAKLQAAILLFNKGEYEKAIEYLNDYSAKEALIGAAAYSLQGDCYVNLEKYNEEIYNHKRQCSCGHKVFIHPKRSKALCSWCGHYVYKDKKEEFKNKLLGEIRKNE